MLLLPYSSAQITSGGAASTTGLISNLLGLNFSEPYVVIGFSATFGLMWLSVYIIFKVSIERIDSSYGGRRDTPFADAMGIDDDNSRNILAVLTLLITLSTVGTGAFAGLIQGWQSLVLLLFAFMLLAGLMFVLVGGTGGIIGGAAYTTGKAAKIASRNIEKMKEDVDELRGEEEALDDIEDEIREEEKDARRREERDDESEDSSGSGSGGGSGGSRETGGDDSNSGGSSASDTETEINDIIQKLMKALKILEDIEEKLSEDLKKESERIEDRRSQIKELRKILTSDENPYRRLRELIRNLEDKGISSSSSRKDLERVLEEHDISYPDIDTLQKYITELKELEQSLYNLKKEIGLLKEIEGIIERLQREVGGAEKEEEILEELIKRLEDSETKQKFIEKVQDEERELDKIEERFNRLKQFISKIKELLTIIDELESDLGDIENLISRLEEFRNVAKMLKEHSSSKDGAHETVEMLSFNPGDSNYITEGTKFTLPGSDETALIDISIKLTPSENPDELEFNNTQKNLILQIGSIISRELSRENKGIELEGKNAKQKRHLGDGELDVEGLMRMIFRIIMGNKNISGGGGEYYLTEQIEGPKYNSELINAIYLGSLINDLKATYSTAMKEFESQGDGRALTKPSIKEYEANSNVYLSSYSNNGTTEPIVLLKDPEGLHGFLIRSEKIIENIDEDRLSGTYVLD